MVAVLPGMHAIGEPPVLGIAAFALFMALINASIKPIIHVIALPFSIISFGLVALVINWLFMQLASWLALSFSLWASLLTDSHGLCLAHLL